MSAPVNVERTASGRIRPICEHCGRKGRAVADDGTGRVWLHQIGQGWSVAPYPPEFVHRDGSVGDLFTCPSCRRRLERGEGLRSRAYLVPEVDDDPTEDDPTEAAQHVERSAARAKASFRADTMSRQGAERYVSEVLGEYAPEHDVPAIVEDLHEHAGSSWDMRRVPSVDFWRVVRAHGLNVPSPASRCADWPLCGHEGGTCPTD